jgi:hypothetical protein
MINPNFSDQRPIVAQSPLLKNNPGPFLARVVINHDPDHSGTIRVQILHEGSTGDQLPGELVKADYLSHYWSGTPTNFNGTANTFQDTQKSWGAWIPTPEIGSIVVVIYIEGNSGKAYWLGGVINSPVDGNKNFSVPDKAATTYNIQDNSKRLPVAEWNETVTEVGPPETELLKPVDPISTVFENQGLLEDDIRGITSTSARRESPSNVFGFNTPGPLDYTSPKKDIGTPNDTALSFVHKLGGSVFVMDDGDKKFFRKTPASDGPPEYVTGPFSGGDNTIPHNELIRLRTRTGHQILLHNSEDLIYIGNAKGTTWIELTSNGKIDIFAEDSISIHTKNDLNIRADRDLNLEAGRNVNIKAAGIYPEGDKINNGKIHLESVKDFEIISNADTKITTVGNLYLSTTGNHIEQAKKIHMNGPDALKVKPLTTYFNPTEKDGTTLESILLRVPSHEPWPLHEHLSPADFIPKKTDITTSTAATPPGKWTLYTSLDDTFKQNKG